MKKFYSFMLMACAMLVSANVWATDVADLAGLKTALAQGGEITLTADISTSETLEITKATTITATNRSICLKGTARDVIYVRTSEPVVFQNMTIYASNENGRGICVNDANLATDITIDNVTINTNRRAISYYEGSNGSALNVTNSLFQYVRQNGSVSTITKDANGNPFPGSTEAELEDAYKVIAAGEDARGIALWEMKNFTMNVENSILRGFDYVINCGPSAANGDYNYEGSVFNVINSTMMGRCAYNVHVANAEFVFTDSKIVGVNRFTGKNESFACFVFDSSSNNCLLTINGGSFASAEFPGKASINANAREYMVTDRGSNNTIVINNAQYTCPKEYGNQKGGIVEISSVTADITINGGIYDCPNIVGTTYGDGLGAAGNITINGGTFDVNVVAPDMTDTDVYRTIEINGGNFTVADTENGIDAVFQGEKLLADGMDVNTNVDGSTTAMPAEEVANVKTVDNIDGEAYQLQVAAGKTLTVADGETVVIGEGGIILEDATSQIKVEEGGKLVLNGDINGTKDENSIVINTSEANTAALYINPAVNVYGAEHPKGTINLISKAYTISEGNYVWQRFGIPTFDGNVTMTWDGTATWIKKADTQTETYTNVLSNATSGNETFTDLVPFASYTMNSDHAAPGAVYTFTGNLMGNQDAELNMIKGASGWNYFANSYTAPIDIYAMLQTLKANYGDNVSVTVYVYQKAGNTWDVINLADMELAALGISEAPQTVINPMQAFILYLYNGTEAQAKINYNDDVFAPATTAAAPRRVVATNVNNAIRFTVANSLYTDNATIIEGANFSDNFDNGYDAQKYMNEANFNLYAVTAEGEMATVATNDIEGTRLAFNAAQAGNYTLTFNTNAANYALKDNATNAVINIENGATYSFNAEAGVNEARFTVIGRADAPTALENTNATVKRAGIYTLTGQYLGETSMFNTLPQGVYVVDGKKVVR